MKVFVPRFHQSDTLFQQVRTTVCLLDVGSHCVSQRQFKDFAWYVRLLGRPRRNEVRNRDRGPFDTLFSAHFSSGCQVSWLTLFFVADGKNEVGPSRSCSASTKTVAHHSTRGPCVLCRLHPIARNFQ